MTVNFAFCYYRPEQYYVPYFLYDRVGADFVNIHKEYSQSEIINEVHRIIDGLKHLSADYTTDKQALVNLSLEVIRLQQLLVVNRQRLAYPLPSTN
jgi:hypothetical protein